jgi:hypothetical protein
VSAEPLSFPSKDHGADWRLALLDCIHGSLNSGAGLAVISRDFFQSAFWPKGLTYAHLCSLILDERFDWLSIMVSTQHDVTKRGMLPYLMSQVRPNRHLDYDLMVGSALRERYSPNQIALIFSSAECLPSMIGSIGTSIDERNTALERIACILLEDQATLNEWVTLLMRKILDRLPSRGSKVHSEKWARYRAGFTAAHHDLAPIPSVSADQRGSLLTLMCVLAFSSVLAPDAVKISLKRYTRCSLYQLADPEITGLFDIKGNLVHRAFVQGMYLNAENVRAFARVHLGADPIQEKDMVMCGALLACAPYMPRQPYAIRDLLAVEGSENSALTYFANHYLFSWRDDLTDKIISGPRMGQFRSDLTKPELMLLVFKGLIWSASLSRTKAQKCGDFYKRLPKGLRLQIYDMIEQRLMRPMGARDLESRGSAMKLLAAIASKCQVSRIHAVIQPTLAQILKNVLDQPGQPSKVRGMGDWQLLGAVADLCGIGALSLSDIGPHIRSQKVLSSVVKALAIDPVRLIEHLSPAMQAECLEADLGL